jgi:hypothetical protein
MPGPGAYARVRLPLILLTLATITTATTAGRGPEPWPRMMPQVLFSDDARAALRGAWVADSADAYQVERAWCGYWRLEEFAGAGPHPRVYRVEPASVTGATTGGLATVSCPSLSVRGRGGPNGNREAAPASPGKTTFPQADSSTVLAPTTEVLVDGAAERRPVIIHTHPPFSCRTSYLLDPATGLVLASRETCARGGDLAYLCAPSYTDQMSLIASARAFGVVYCDEHALVPFWNPHAEMSR